MKLTDLSIDRSTTVFVLLLLIVITGVMNYTSLPRENYPEIIIPLIIATTTYDGVAPQDIETLVTIPIERELTGITGIKQIRSWSAEGISQIEIEFTPDIDVEVALQKVRDKIDQARPELPPDADDPVLREVNFSEFPIMFLSLTGSAGLPVLTQLAEDMEDELEAIKGVLEVNVIGGVEREIQIIVDPERIIEYGVSMSDIVNLARVENVNTPAGSMELGEAKYLVRVPGEFQNMDDIKDLVVKANEAGVVYVRDIATVVDGFKETLSISRLDGMDAVTLSVTKRAGENIITLSDAVADVVHQFEDRLLGDTEVHVTMDQSVEIRDMVAELENSILSGLILVLIVMFIFLGFTNAIFVALAIPISMMICFTILALTGTTLNMVVLFSLMLALGMLVDNGIVVVENMYRYVQTGMEPVAAAKRGAKEVAWPITASTITTVVAFAPMFFWPGIWGEFMRYLPMTLTFCLLGSLFVGLVVNPALASRLMRRQKVTKEKKARRHPILSTYRRLLETALQWRAVTVTLAVTLLVVITTVFLSSAQIEFQPKVEPSRAYVDIDGPQGTKLEVTDGVVATVEERVEAYRDALDYLLANVGSRGADREGGSSGGETNIGRVTLDFPKLSEAKRMPTEVIHELRDQFDDLTGTDVIVDEEQEGPETGPPINIEITGNDFETLAKVAQRVVDAIKDIPDIVNARDDYDKAKPELRVNVDRQQALMTGLNTQFIGESVQAAVNGRKAGEFREGDEEYDVTVRFPKSFREDIANIEAMSLVNQNGQAVPFAAVAELEQGAGFGYIRRIDRKRTITVSAQVENRSGAEVLRDVQEALVGFTLPPGYNMLFTGENEDMEESQAFLSRAFLVALFLIALVLITQFNSIVQPFIIMSSVILSLAGVFLGLYAFRMPFGVLMTGIGCISLAGVVVNNAIVLIDFINQRRAEGLKTNEAIVDAGITRFRPVMLTAITTILGLIPMALGVSFDFRNWVWIVGGESSQYWGPMATAVIFGLAFATILTLVVVPVLYSLTASAADLVSSSPDDSSPKPDADALPVAK